jgi:hypothetical protein
MIRYDGRWTDMDMFVQTSKESYIEKLQEKGREEPRDEGLSFGTIDPRSPVRSDRG